MKPSKSLRLALLSSTLIALVLTGVVFALSVSKTGEYHFPLRWVVPHPKAQRAAALMNAVPIATTARTVRPVSLPAHRLLSAAAIGEAREVAHGIMVHGSPIRTTTTSPNLATSSVIIPEAVRTYDTFAPPPTFVNVFSSLTTAQLTADNIASSSLVSNNKEAIYTSTGRYVIFSANLSPDGKYHIWAAVAAGGVPFQLTTGSGNELFPALTSDNEQIAFTSDNQTPGTFNLYTMPFTTSGSAVNVSTLTSLTIRPDLSSIGFTNIQRPTWAPGSDKIAFSALTSSSGPGVGGHWHIYFLYTATDGYLPPAPNSPASGPAALTDGPADDFNPAWSPDGAYIAFDSTAGAMASTNIAAAPGSPPTVTSSPGSLRSIWMIGGGSVSTLGAGSFHVTNGASDDIEPAWAPLGSGPFDGDIAYSRGTSPTAGRNIFYLNAITLAGDAEHQEGFGDTAIELPTENSSALFTDEYPSWSPSETTTIAQVARIAYDSNRSITYNDPNTGNPSETAINLPPGTQGIGSGYTGILQSELASLTPPTLLRFNSTSGEIVHINNGNTPILPSASDPSGGSIRVAGASGRITFSVRLSDREAGNDDNNIYIQIKDPDSRYQDSGGREHKVFTKDATYYTVRGLPIPSSAQLYNGDGVEYVDIRNQPSGGTYRGASGGRDTDPLDPITLGRNGGGLNQITNTATPAESFIVAEFAIGDGQYHNDPDPNMFVPYGQEFECQVVNPSFAGPDTVNTDYVDPFYLAGVDDQFPQTTPQPRPATEWLKLTKSTTQDTNGGVLYSASWTSPSSTSDYYLDVISYDKEGNWRIYDNVWGFTTQGWSGSNNVLLVNDNGLGQKFALTTFGPYAGLGDLTPVMYGTESYFSDVDVNLFPNEVYTRGATLGFPINPTIKAAAPGAAPATLTAFSQDGAIELVWNGSTGAISYNIYRGTAAGLEGPTPIGNTTNTFFIDNTVQITNPVTVYYYVVRAVLAGGVLSAASNEASASPNVPIATGVTSAAQLIDMHSYLNEVLVNTAPRNGLGFASYPSQTQKYDIWRVLCRGPVDAQLASYLSQPQSQPAVADGATSAIAAPSVPVSKRCVLWLAPFAGRLFEGPGSIDSPTVQTDLAKFVATGGHLFVGGAAVPDALTNGGSSNNVSTSFIQQTLSSVWASSRGGSQNLAGANANANRISHDEFFNPIAATQQFEAITGWLPSPATDNTEGGLTFVYSPPSASALLLGNNYLIENPAGGSVNQQYPAQIVNWRTDASLDQLGGQFSSFGANNNVVLARMPTITPANGGHVDFTYNPEGDVNGSFIPGSDGLIYNELPGGGRTVFSAFGLEGLSLEYYNIPSALRPHYFAHNQRPNVLHNIIEYLRTGTASGTVLSTNGSSAPTPLANAIVYMTPDGGGPIPTNTTRNLYSATTQSDGSYIILGIEPGVYIFHAYEPGYSDAVSNAAYICDADHDPGVSLQLTKLATGSITGTVKDQNGNGIIGAAVTFTSLDGTVVFSTTSGTGGIYTINGVAASGSPGVAYNGAASFDGVTAVSVPNPVDVISSATATANFTITLPNGTIGGLVTNGSTHLVGLTVTIQPNPTGTALTAVTTADITPIPVSPLGDGSPQNYSRSVPAGSYTVSVTQANFTIATKVVTVTSGAFTRADLNITPFTGPTGTLSGLVTDNSATPNVITGATVTVTDPLHGNAVIASATTAGGPTINYTITSIPVGTYNVQATAPGFGPSAIASVVISNGIVTNQNLVLTVTPPAITLAAGALYYFSSPYDYSALSISQIFGPLNTSTTGTPNGTRSHLFYWSPTLLEYLTDPTPPANTIQLGYGYWIQAFENIPIAANLGPRPTIQSISVRLYKGWNAIGVPSLLPINVSALNFQNPAGGTLTFDQASSVAFNLVSPTLYGWDSTANAYITLHSATVSPIGNTALKEWQGYWIYANVPCTILIPTGN